MIRSSELVDKLVADLHFHKFFYVEEGDNMFTDRNEVLSHMESFISSLGLAKDLNVHTDFFHGGSVVNSSKIDHIYQYIDDVFIDYFFRTYNFKEIIFPKGFCYEQITPKGIVHPEGEIVIHLNNLYDRCTFVNNIWRLFGLDNYLFTVFPKNGFIKQFYLDRKFFGLHTECGVLLNEIPFNKDFDEYLDRYYTGKSYINPLFRGIEIFKYARFLYEECEHSIYNCHPSYQLKIHNFSYGFSQIRENHLFGEYTIEDILFIYALLTDKFILTEDAFLLSICHCLGKKIENDILAAFIGYEALTQDYHMIEPYICSKDLYLRFASHTKSKAFNFSNMNDAVDYVQLFQQEPVPLIRIGNTMPLPYLYEKLNQ